MAEVVTRCAFVRAKLGGQREADIFPQNLMAQLFVEQMDVAVHDLALAQDLAISIADERGFRQRKIYPVVPNSLGFFFLLFFPRAARVARVVREQDKSACSKLELLRRPPRARAPNPTPQ